MKTLAQSNSLDSSLAKRNRSSSVHSAQAEKTRVQRATIHHIVQARLTIGHPNDSYEQEADRVADRIVSQQPVPAISAISGSLSAPAAPGVQTQSLADERIQEKEIQCQAEEEEAVQAKLIQRQAEEEEEAVQAKLIQRQSEEEEEALQTRLLQRQPEEEDEALQAKLLQRQPEEEEEAVQAKLLQRQPEEEEEAVQAKLLQRQPEEEEEAVQAKLLQRQPEEEEEAVQAKLLRRQPEEEEEAVQAKLLQRQAEEEEMVQTRQIQRRAETEEEGVQAQGAIPSTRAASQAVNSPSSASPMRADVRAILESGMGADLGNVRVHEDSTAHQAAASINARAFTHKSDIWLGAGQSQSDLHLMAHEATHVVQQGASQQSSHSGVSADIAQTAPRVQRFWNPVTAISNAVGDAVEWVGDRIGDAINFIKEKASEFVQDMPGYSLFTVINGSDPITGRSVERNGRNFIEAGLDVIPNGAALKQKLEQEGALAEAAEWLDEEIAALDFSPAEIAAQLSAFWSSLTLADATRLPTVMNRLLGIIRAPINRIIRFAGNVATKLLQIVKDYIVSSLINFIKEHTTAYPLLTVILGRDPISGEVVERTPMALIRGFMLLSESGAEQLRQMEESGSLQKAADWLDAAVERLNLSWEMLVEGFKSIWDSVGIHSLLEPLGVFRQIYNTFAAPVGRIINFVIEVGRKILEFIKDALIGRLVAYARTVRGYPLLSVILGKDPFSDEPVERSAENIIHGFMSLMEGGEEQFQEMKQTGAIARLTTRIENAIATLNFTWEYIKGLFIRAWESFSLADLAAPFDAFMRLMGIFGRPLLRLISFVGEIIRIVIEVVLKLMNFPVALISNIITKAMQAFDDIKRDPIGFLKNLLRAVKTGFVKFFGNIATHLINGVTGWLFKELEDAGISPPTDFSFQSILGFVLDVLGISVDRIFQKLAARIGQERVDRIRGMMDRLTGVWRFVSDVVTRGPIAIWEYIQEQLSNLWSIVLDAVRNWVVTRIIQQITVKLLSMLDPTGIMAVVNGFIAFYKAIQSFIAYLREMLEVVNSFVEGVAEIARGSVESAASFLEGSLGRAMPIVIGFLANQVGLGGLGRRIGEMIERVRELVDRGLDWLIDRAVSGGMAFMNLLRGGGGADARPMNHDAMIRALRQRLSTPSTASDPAEAIREKKDLATRLQNEYQPRLENGIRLTITTDESLAGATQDNDIDFNIRIAPNDATGTASSPISGQWPEGTAADPIPIRWYKSPTDFPTIQSQGPTAGVTLPATAQRDAQTLRVSQSNFPSVGTIMSRRAGREDTNKSQVYSRLNDLETASGWVISASRANRAIDHVKDLQWRGQDAFDNLWPLERSKNSGANSSKYQRATAMEGGSPVTKTVGSWGLTKHFWIAEIVSPTSGHSTTDPVNDGNAIPKKKP